MSGPSISIKCFQCGVWGTIRLRDKPKLKRPWLCADCRRLSENNPNWKGGISQWTYGYKLKYPERVRARKIAEYAKRTGKLVPQPCEVCGATETQMHHDDYSKPLQVRWICQRHHKKG